MSTSNTKAYADVLGGVTPYLHIDGAFRAAEFYKAAFGAREIASHQPDDKGRTLHIHLDINGGSVMLCDFFPEHDHPFKPPQAFSLHLEVDDVDAWWNRAVAAGATVVMPLAVMFWGARYGMVRDPFGVTWSMGMPADTK